MPEQQEDKSRLPLAGLLALATIAGGLFIYQDISLKTARPIDKEKTSNSSPEKTLVQARLWQDPFEALETHRLNEEKRLTDADLKDPAYDVDDVIEAIKTVGESGAGRGLHIMPVFVDGSPYASGSETRLNDRYAVVSALGAAGYVPESGEHIRFFKWNRSGKSGGPGIFVPVELFKPKKKIGENAKNVLVVWLKEQDFSEKPLEYLNRLLNETFKKEFKNKTSLTYSVLGPRFSTGLSTMLKELQTASKNADKPSFSVLNDVKFYSPWATAGDAFILDDLPDSNKSKASKEIVDKLCEGRLDPKSSNASKATVEKLFICSGIKDFVRTIRTDAVLAEQLIAELKRRRVDLTSCSGKNCPKVALISEWDMLYGRSLPRTFAAVAMNNGYAIPSPALDSSINKLRKDNWPPWVSQYSYLAGLDGELPVQAKEKKTGTTQGNSKTDRENQAADPETMERPEGRSQLDYIRRLAQSLKQEQEQTGEDFGAIGVLGGDIYDKLLILQALRPMFPTAIFFTTDLHARLAHPSQWQWTRNLIVASHFGLELQKDLQAPIPPFRDSYQTSLFYAALWALGHFEHTANCQDCFQLSSASKEPVAKKFLKNGAPRLYEIGRHGAFDISSDSKPYPSNYLSIHPPRPSLSLSSDPWKSLVAVVAALVVITCLVLIAALISNTVIDRIWLAWEKWSPPRFVITFVVIYGLIGLVGLVQYVTQLMSDPEGEPFTLTEGISAWPTVAIRLTVLLISGFFLWYSWHKLKNNKKELEENFNLSGEANGLLQPPGVALSVFSAKFLDCCAGIHRWRPKAGDQIAAALLWKECVAYGEIKVFIARAVLQVGLVYFFALLLIGIFGPPSTPCRGEDCFELNYWILRLSIIAMLLLVFYVIDATNLCRTWVDCITKKEIRWPNGRLTKIAREQGQGEIANKQNPKKKESPEQNSNPEPREDSVVRGGVSGESPPKQNNNPGSGEDLDYLDEWLGIELIAERTKVLGHIVWFPFIALFLLGISRHTYLDNWDFPVALILIYVLMGVLIFGNAMALRGAAEAAKRKAVERLESRLIGFADEIPDQQRQKRQVEWAINKIENNHKGAFLPFTHHPIFAAAIALPSGGYGLVLLFEYLATAF